MSADRTTYVIDGTNIKFPILNRNKVSVKNYLHMLKSDDQSMRLNFSLIVPFGVGIFMSVAIIMATTAVNGKLR